jgi:hypothetical protein
MTRAPSSKLLVAIDDSSVINLNSDYPIDSTKQNLNDVFDLNREVELSPQAACAIDTLITRKDTTISLILGFFSEEVPHSKKNFESYLKIMFNENF